MPDDWIPASPYDQDFDAWATRQAAALRAAAEGLSNGSVQPMALLSGLDLDYLAEEVEGLGKRDRRELGSRLAAIV